MCACVLTVCVCVCVCVWWWWWGGGMCPVDVESTSAHGRSCYGCTRPSFVHLLAPCCRLYLRFCARACACQAQWNVHAQAHTDGPWQRVLWIITQHTLVVLSTATPTKKLKD